MRLLFAGLFGLFFAACSTNTPKYVSEDYLKSIYASDFRKAKSYVYVPASIQNTFSADDIEAKLSSKFAALKQALDKIHGIKDFKIVAEKELSETLSELKVECVGNNGQILDKNFNMLKLGGKWKVIEAL